MARTVIRNALFFGSGKLSSFTVPWCTYTEPEVAHVGLYAEDAKKKGIKISEFKKDFDDIDRNILEGKKQGFVKGFISCVLCEVILYSEILYYFFIFLFV